MYLKVNQDCGDVTAGASCGMGRLAAWHLPGGPVGPPARWGATSNVEVDQMKSTVGHFIFR